MPQRSADAAERRAPPTARKSPKKRARRRSYKGNSHTTLSRDELEQMLVARAHERAKA
jgi:hypothetical protein